MPFPSGTGHMIQSLQSKEIDVGIGLTEGWVAGIGKAIAEKGDAKAAGYQLVGTYVETPLCWAISTGTKRDINGVDGLRGKKIGVSRIGRCVQSRSELECWRNKRHEADSIGSITADPT